MSGARSVAILGLDNSHPFVDATNLRALDPLLSFTLVGNIAPERRERFLTTFPGTRIEPSLEKGLAQLPSGVLVTLRPSRLLETLPALASSGLPAFMNKQALATRSQVDRAKQLILGTRHRLMSSSVLRFAPDVQNAGVDVGVTRTIRIAIRHGVEHWRQPGNGWQGDLELGGGVIGSLGYHGLEILDQIAGPGFAVTQVSMTDQHNSELLGGSAALISLERPDGLTATIELDATVTGEHYEMLIRSDQGEQRLSIDPDRDDGYGYRATMSAFLQQMAGETPLDWERSLQLFESAADAHTQAYTTSHRTQNKKTGVNP